MKKRILYLLLALVLVLALSVPALAAETFYPVSVDEYTGRASTRSTACPCRMTRPASPQMILSATGGSTTCWT